MAIEIVPQSGPEIRTSKRSKRKAELLELAREQREQRTQEIIYAPRPFILCGLPTRRPPADCTEWIRRNGKYILRIVADPKYGLPWGQDILIPIWTATVVKSQPEHLRHEKVTIIGKEIPAGRVLRFRAGIEVLETFGLPRKGTVYRRVADGFLRTYAATTHFGTEMNFPTARMVEMARFHFFDYVKLWRPKRGIDDTSIKQLMLSDDETENLVVLSEDWYSELIRHPIPIERNVVAALTDSPGALKFYLWLGYRSYTVSRRIDVPLFGVGGLQEQLGDTSYKPWEYRAKLKGWLEMIRFEGAPDLPHRLTKDGDSLTVFPHRLITDKGHHFDPY